MVLTRMMVGSISRKMFNVIASKAGQLLDQWEGQKEVEEWVKKINKEGWVKGADWFESVPEGVWDFNLKRVKDAMVDDVVDDEASENGEADEDHEGGGDGAIERLELNLEPDPEGVLLPGLGTMMQDTVDWTSEIRKQQYEEWKEGILERLENVEGGRGVEVH